MKHKLLLILTALVAGAAGGTLGAAALQARYGSMPNNWAAWKQVAENTPAGAPNALGGVIGQVSPVAMPDGGPQALEGYTYLSHPTGTTRLAFGVISNVELAGAGGVTEVRSMQSGGVVTGSGKIGRWVGIAIARPGGTKGLEVPFVPILVTDQQALTILRGTISTDKIRFSNGWILQPAPAGMQLVDERGVVRQEF